ncbi:hypothetical protein LshimejAT787_0107820 [Lyophyllum shimeji]|uniref:Uncharacterized protein n=1 Tax=Lyophyllum shimeji TaxID=47721 RepID=A0A9P3PDL5_LYOSH|nr:hypothetical protein LshimejAT787_0107820 [Lyophyllum shimeji]
MLDRLDFVSKEALDKAQPAPPPSPEMDQLHNIDTSTFSKDLLAILGSDNVANTISAEIAKMVDYRHSPGLPGDDLCNERRYIQNGLRRTRAHYGYSRRDISEGTTPQSNTKRSAQSPDR